MRVTVCGHAALYIETIDQRILLDPCFSDTLMGGTLTYHPGRVLEVEKLPSLTAVVVTHGHFDHFHPATLQQLPLDLPVITADEPRLIEQLHKIGFSQIIICQPWQAIALGETSLIPTPSDHEEPEFGLLVQDRTGTFWHMADGEVTAAVGERITTTYGAIDLISTKYQPVVRASMGHLHSQGATFDAVGVASWLEAACACNPGLVFPYASGLCFADRHGWFNRYAFPLSAAEAVGLLQRRLGDPDRAVTVRPGDVLEIQTGQQPQRLEQSSPFVRSEPSLELRWEPIDLSTLFGLSVPAERLAVQERLENLLADGLLFWLQQQVQMVDSIWSSWPEMGVVWQLVVHLGEAERLNYALDFRSPDLLVVSGEHPEANFFTHIAGQGLADVMSGKVSGSIFWLAGEVRSYEKVISIRDGHFAAPIWPEQPEDFPSDPLTYYLRHIGTGGSAVSSSAPGFKSLQLAQDLDILTNLGENPAVMHKKVLLAYLARQEAERLGLDITEAEIQEISDSFRDRFNLQDAEATEQWLKVAGLSLADYSAVLRDLTAVVKIGEHYRNEVNALLTNHRRVATARQARSHSLPHES